MKGVDGMADVGVADSAGSFSDFYRAEYASAVQLAHLLTGSSSECEDVAQDAFARLQLRFAELEEPAAYLRVTIVNLCRSRHRRQARVDRRRHLTSVVEPVPLGAQELLDAVDTLPYRYKAVIVLRYWADLTEVEIAKSSAVRRARSRRGRHEASDNSDSK